MDKIVVDLPNGMKLVAEKSSDSHYPGIYVTLEGVQDNSEEVKSVPTVLMEHCEGELRALVWADKESEDYTHKIKFEV